MTDVQERSDTIRERVRADMVTTLRVHLGLSFALTGTLLDDLTENAMHHVDHLLVNEKQFTQEEAAVWAGEKFAIMCAESQGSTWEEPPTLTFQVEFQTRLVNNE